jgi:hypothetical protein
MVSGVALVMTSEGWGKEPEGFSVMVGVVVFDSDGEAFCGVDLVGEV